MRSKAVMITHAYWETCLSGLTNTPCPSNTNEYWEKAMAQVHCSPLFQGIIRRVQNSLQEALNAAPCTFESLHHEYSKYTILPQEYASALLLE